MRLPLALVLSLAATPLAAQEPSLARPQLLLKEVVTGMRADLAAAARPRSSVLPAATVIALFDDALPGIVSG